MPSSLIIHMGPVTPFNPPANLQTAINAATAGDTINATGGTYTGAHTINKALTIVGGTINVSTGTRAITVSASNVTLDGLTITGNQHADWASDSVGVWVGTPVTNLTIQNCTLSNFGNGALWLDRVTGLQIDHNNIADCAYVGMMLLSAVTAVIENNNVVRIGESWYSGGNRTGIDDNAYGIAVTQQLYPATMASQIIIRNNFLEDIPSWHGIDCHCGEDISITGNVLSEVRIPLWASNASGSPTRVAFTDNECQTFTYIDKSFYASVIVGSTDCSVTDNQFATGFPDVDASCIPVQSRTAGNDRVLVQNSTGTTVSGNTLI